MSEILVQRTGEADIASSSDGRLSLTIPIQIRRRAGRCRVALPNGESPPSKADKTEATAIQLALARGHRWLAMLESGEASSLREVARREKVDDSYVNRMVNLTSLAPDIVAAILAHTLPERVTLFDLAVEPPLLWDEQVRLAGAKESETQRNGKTNHE